MIKFAGVFGKSVQSCAPDAIDGVDEKNGKKSSGGGYRQIAKSIPKHKENVIKTFLEWIVTWFFADHLASKQKEAGEPDHIRLQPANSAMRPIILHNHEIRILGVVCGMIRKYRYH
jgi:hypothetical protein